jgi:predicted nucleotidyltransferase
MDWKNMLPENNDWIKDSIILLGIVGSHAYGTNIETSDLDYKGICIPPKRFYIGLDSFNEFNNTGGKNWKNTADDIDINIIAINKFVKDAAEGVPNNIELLFTRPQEILFADSAGKLLIENRHLFLSQMVKSKIIGYSNAQQSRIKNQNRVLDISSTQAGRSNLVEEFGYDTKKAMHSVRLLLGCIQILRDADFSTYRPERKLLLEIRSGKYQYQDIVDMIKELQEIVERQFKKTSLPKTPDREKINNLLMSIVEDSFY